MSRHEAIVRRLRHAVAQRAFVSFCRVEAELVTFCASLRYFCHPNSSFIRSDVLFFNLKPVLAERRDEAMMRCCFMLLSLIQGCLSQLFMSGTSTWCIKLLFALSQERTLIAMNLLGIEASNIPI